MVGGGQVRSRQETHRVITPLDVAAPATIHVLHTLHVFLKPPWPVFVVGSQIPSWKAQMDIPSPGYGTLM